MVTTKNRFGKRTFSSTYNFNDITVPMIKQSQNKNIAKNAEIWKRIPDFKFSAESHKIKYSF